MVKCRKFLVGTIVAIAGCQSLNEKVIPPLGEPTQAEPVMTVQQSEGSMERRFSDTAETKVDPVQVITTWSQRYDDLFRQTEQLRESNTKITLDNTRLQQEVEKLKAELQQCRRDMEQSNAVLEQAHLELSKWKADVLGFRDEIRQAQTAQLSALTKILRILGAETSPVAGEKSPSPAAASQEVKP
jgi:chromosome segregation ATPase